MRYDSNHKARTRATLLAEAAAAIRSEGPRRVSVSRIMGAAGLTHGGFYVHFRSKDDLIAHAITHMFDHAHTHFLDVTEGKPATAALTAYIDSYLSPERRDDRANGCPFAALGSDVTNLPEAGRRRFDEGIGRLLRSVRLLLEQLGSNDPEGLAESTIAELAGTLVLARVHTSPKESGRVLRRGRESVKRKLGLPTAR